MLPWPPLLPGEFGQVLNILKVKLNPVSIQKYLDVSSGGSAGKELKPLEKDQIGSKLKTVKVGEVPQTGIEEKPNDPSPGKPSPPL